ncbi:MAG: PadR family transcriptional regulator [Mariniblastus sp.]
MSKKKKAPILQGSLDLLVLQSLKQGPMHGYSITRHLKQASKEYLQIEEGSLYPALHRMERRGWIAAHWGTSESNRRAKFYQLTSDGKKHLKSETAAWEKMSEAINRVVSFQFPN